MTGHDLDLDAIASRSRAPEPEDVPALVAEIESLNRQLDTPPWTTVDMLTAKLAAAEQERDDQTWRADVAEALCAAAKRDKERAEAALAAVREASVRHPHTCGQHPDGDPVSCGWKAAVMDMRAALAAAGQPEPERAIGRCGSRGPRISGEGRPICALPAGHAGWHRGDESWTYGGMSAPEWGDLTGKPEPTPEQRVCESNPRTDGQPWKPWEGNGPCQDCGGRNIVWCTDNSTWARMMGERGGLLCPVCFVKRAHLAGLIGTWWLSEPTPEQP